MGYHKEKDNRNQLPLCLFTRSIKHTRHQRKDRQTGTPHLFFFFLSSDLRLINNAVFQKLNFKPIK